MRYTFYTTSEKAWDAMLFAISGARASVFLEMYIFADNTVGYNFFEVLAQKAREGVKVKIIVDSFGSQELDEKTVAKIRAAGAEVLFFSYWLRRTHKKILVVDENTAFVGGVNIHKFFRKWNDLQVRLSGRMVRSIIHSFAKSYRLCGGQDARFLASHPAPRLSKKGGLKKRYEERLRNARTSIVMVTPYFMPHRWLIGALHQAVLRGISVSVLVPAHTDRWIMNRINYAYITQLHQAGIAFYLQRKMNHAKALLIDGAEGMVGSHNIDPLSFNHNLEAGIFFRDEKMALDLAKIIGEWKRDCVLFHPSMHKKTWFDYILAPLISLFQSVV